MVVVERCLGVATLGGLAIHGPNLYVEEIVSNWRVEGVLVLD